LKESGRFADVLEGASRSGSPSDVSRTGTGWTEAAVGVLGDVQVGSKTDGYRAQVALWEMEGAAVTLLGLKQVVHM
jgi:hypothetical protein